jgi:hypothetical protein
LNGYVIRVFGNGGYAGNAIYNGPGWTVTAGRGNVYPTRTDAENAVRRIESANGFPAGFRLEPAYYGRTEPAARGGWVDENGVDRG